MINHVFNVELVSEVNHAKTVQIEKFGTAWFMSFRQIYPGNSSSDLTENSKYPNYLLIYIYIIYIYPYFFFFFHGAIHSQAILGQMKWYGYSWLVFEKKQDLKPQEIGST